jgi:pimeloyl-ACP methyl ester carboxylesterase
MTDFKTATLTASDGTRIGYRRIGQGPGIILVHGALQSSLNFTKLAQALSVDFTVYVPDRRGRGLSGAYGQHDDRITEAKDILALAHATGTVHIFGLSSGAIITLQAALLDRAIQKIALYEPPIPLDEQIFKKLDIDYERAMRAGNLGRAFVAILKGTGDTSFFTRFPSFILAPLANWMMKAQSNHKAENEIALQTLVPTFRQDRVVTQGAAQLIADAGNLQAAVLLLQGAQRKDFLKQPLDRLEAVIGRAERVEFKNQGHLAADNSGAPLKVAAALRHFFNS